MKQLKTTTVRNRQGNLLMKIYQIGNVRNYVFRVKDVNKKAQFFNVHELLGQMSEMFYDYTGTRNMLPVIQTVNIVAFEYRYSEYYKVLARYGQYHYTFVLQTSKIPE